MSLPRQEITYSQFKTLVKQGLVTDIVLEKDSVRGNIKPEGIKEILSGERLQQIRHDPKNPLSFSTVRVDDPTLITELEKVGISFRGEVTSTWLPTLLWRTTKTWRGVRPEVPWLDRSPAEIVRAHVRLTLQPLDAPRGDPQALARTLEHIGSDRMLLFSTDYPHWHFDGEDVLPEGLPPEMLHKILIDNALATYPRLRDEAILSDNTPASEETVR
jgi:hypothetical protein